MGEKTVMLGGRQLTEDVARALQVSFASAERIKLECANVHFAHADKVDASSRSRHSGYKAEMRQASQLPVLSTVVTRAVLSEITFRRIDFVLRHVPTILML